MIGTPIQSFNFYKVAMHTALPVKPVEKPEALHPHQEERHRQRQTPDKSSLDTLGNGRLL
ncbi:hypothetical protein CXQ82_26070 [Pseudomonas sp. S09G 359]|jgi:hypothetical protein|nr:hypothetical protein CXQ82_26070 [Pseudomonas sp. S09G 359]